MLWKSDLSSLEREWKFQNGILYFHLDLAIKQSNGNSSSAMVLIGNFTLNLENVPLSVNQRVLMGRKREYFAFHGKFSFLAAGGRSLAVPRVGFSEWDFQSGIFKNGIFQSGIFQNKTPFHVYHTKYFHVFYTISLHVFYTTPSHVFHACCNSA